MQVSLETGQERRVPLRGDAGHSTNPFCMKAQNSSACYFRQLKENPMADAQLLEILGLARVAAAPKLLRVINVRLRPPQQTQLLASLRALRSAVSQDDLEEEEQSVVARGALERLEAHFDRKLDVKDELERFLMDLLKIHHFVGSGKGGAKDVARDPRVLLMASTSERHDREQLFRVFQTLGTTTSSVYCRLVAILPPKCVHELLRVFESELQELLEWMKWLSALRLKTSDDPSSSSCCFEVAIEFFGKCVREQCLAIWLKLLKPLESRQRLSVIEVIHNLPVTSPLTSATTTIATAIASPLKKLARFLETTNMLPTKLLELDMSVRRSLPTLLDEFPTVTLHFLLTKFGASAVLMDLLTVQGPRLLGKDGLLHLLESLAALSLESCFIEKFLTALFAFKRLYVFLTLFFRVEPGCQKNIIQLAVGAATFLHGDEGIPIATRLFDLLLVSAQNRNVDLALRNLIFLPIKLVVDTLSAVEISEQYDDSNIADENLTTLGECIHLAASPDILTLVLPLYLGLSQHNRALLVAWLRDIPDMTASLVYRALHRLLGHQPTAMSGVLEMLNGLKGNEKLLLCSEILRDGDDCTLEHEQLLVFLANLRDDGASRRKMLHLLRIIPRAHHGKFILLLRTQPAAQQTALVRLMRSLPSDAISRLLHHISAISIDSIDALFELLVLVPKGEYPALAKLLTSVNIQAEQLETLVTVASDMKNQAASRELVMFASDLPPDVRTLFFQILSDKTPEKGVLLRMMSLSSRVSLSLLCELVQLFHCMDSWEVRSAYVEQLRSLEQEYEIQSAAEVLFDLDSIALRWAVMLLSPFSAQTRVAFCKVMLLIQTAEERRRVLSKLKDIPKYRIGDLIAVICEPQVEHASANFLRVLGVIHEDFQFQLLPLLAKRKWWFFVDIMASEITQNTADGHVADEDAVNALASVLVSLGLDDAHLSLFRSVLEYALYSSVPLHTVTLVARHFVNDLERIVSLLRYSCSLGMLTSGRERCIPLFFRVLAKCSQPELVFSVCRVVDEDDAVFALHRLDRILQLNDQRCQEMSSILDALAAQAVSSSGVSASIISAFFNFIRHHKEIESQVGVNKHLSGDQAIIPRRDSKFGCPPPSSTTKMRTLREQLEWELTIDENWEFEDDNYSSEKRVIPQTSPPSYRRVPLGRHVQLTRPESEEFPRKHSTRKPWWEEIASIELVSATNTTDDAFQNEKRTKTIFQGVQAAPKQSEKNHAKKENHRNPCTLPSVNVSTPNLASSMAPTDIVLVSSNGPTCIQDRQAINTTVRQVTERSMNSNSGAENQNPKCQERRTEVTPQNDTDHCAVGQQHPFHQLSRSESAPEPLGLRRWKSDKQRAKFTRGLCGGLGLSLDFHVDRDVAARALHQQCEDAYNLSAERIRFSKTSAAQAKVMQARVRRAMNQRHLPSVDRLHQNPLLRSDVLTMENATSALSLAEQCRSQSRSIQPLAQGKSLHARRVTVEHSESRDDNSNGFG